MSKLCLYIYKDEKRYNKIYKNKINLKCQNSNCKFKMLKKLIKNLKFKTK